MRARQRLSYAERIERAVAVLERGAAAGELPDIATLADAAALSPFHFHRVFRLMTGETIGEAVTRVRLGGSLPELAGLDGIRAAAARSGYATTQSYARAMKAAAGATPSQLRADTLLRERVGDALRSPAGRGSAPLSVEIVAFEPVRLLALRNVGDYAELNRGYQQLFDLLLQQIAPEDVTGLWGIPHDDPRFVPAAECRFDCAVSTSGGGGPRDGIVQIDLPAGPCLRLRVPGDYDRVHGALDELYRVAIAEDLPISAASPVNYYHSDPEEVPEEDLLADIHLMLEPASDER